jgi:predicted lipid-binding transport protein (Tim44 family)
MKWWPGLLLLLALSEGAGARVGGGESYSGGGGGGSGDDSGLIYFLFRIILQLCLEYPAVGVPLLIAFVVGLAYFHSRPSVKVQEWSNSVKPTRQASAALHDLMTVDPNFSRPLFLDFLGLLYTRAQSQKVAGLQSLAAYLSPEVREKLESDARNRGVTGVDEVIVGSIRLVGVSGLHEEWTSLTVALETNYTEHLGDQKRLYYLVERWYLTRRSGVLSKGPEEITRLACPSCGNPGEPTSEGKCPFCDRLITDGSYGWIVKSFTVTDRLDRPPMAVGGSGEELGTELPTVFQPGFDIRRKEFQASHPDFSWPEFEARVRHIFLNLQKAWSGRSWDEVRPYETDSLFQTHRYWLTALELAGRTNRLEDVQVIGVEAVRVEPDAYFDAITVRIFASMKDYTVDSTGAVVAGSKDRVRRFSEYWTFIRRTGYTRGRAQDPGHCPSCGAPLDRVNMAGVCEYCGAKITSGDFDWVLSRIEQDEAYEA